MELTSARATTTLKVANDGKDFPRRLARKNGIGLKIMKYRARMIGGRLDIGRGRRGGTVITCTFPNDRLLSGTGNEDYDAETAPQYKEEDLHR